VKKNKMDNRKKIEAISIAAFFLLVGTAMISPAAASNVTGIYDAKVNDVVPSEMYIAYNFTYNDSANLEGTNLTWFNITGWNSSIVTNNASFDDIINISLWNMTDPSSVSTN